jgi:hypothetical protein
MYRVRFANIVDNRLGRHVNHDPRSRRFPVRRDVPIVSVVHERHVPVFDQGDTGSCTGNAAVGCMGTGLFYDSIDARHTMPRYPFTEPGAVACYSRATRIDDYAGTYPPTDTGSDGLSVAKAMVEAHEISGYEHAFNLEQGLQALMVAPVITGVTWFTDMFEPDAEGIVHPTGSVAGGHEFVWDSHDEERGLEGFTNSWGEGWGLHGGFSIPTEEWEALLKQDGDVTSFVPITQPAPTPDPVPDEDLHVDAADQALAAAISPWARKVRPSQCIKARKTVRTWLDRKGL